MPTMPPVPPDSAVTAPKVSQSPLGTLYAAFPLQKRGGSCGAWKHACWLNMVEIEIGVLKSQCLDRRIDNRNRLAAELAAWERRRNQNGARINWMFSTEKARAKMARAIQPRH
jgi:hypothetical protein